MNLVFVETLFLLLIQYSLIYGLQVSYDLSVLTKCVDDRYIFHKLLQISLDQCVVECAKRRGCLAISYCRGLTLCDLLSTDGLSEMAFTSTDKECVFVRKSVMHYNLPSECENCKEGENCNLENGNCMKTECPKLSLDNGLLLGNMNGIGNRARFKCNIGYKTETNEAFTICGENGNWSVLPKCVRDPGILFRGTVGIGSQFNTAEAWNAAGSGTTTDASCRNVQRDGCSKHYRHPLIDNWAALNPQLKECEKMRYSIYKNEVEVVWVLFNATGSSKTNWFHQSRVINSSYTDLTPTATYNFFAIDNPSLTGVDRDFYVNQNFGGCTNDNGWFGTFDNTGNCYFDKFQGYPYIWYSKLQTKANTGHEADFDFGDCSLVTVVA